MNIIDLKDAKIIIGPIIIDGEVRYDKLWPVISGKNIGYIGNSLFSDFSVPLELLKKVVKGMDNVHITLEQWHEKIKSDEKKITSGLFHGYYEDIWENPEKYTDKEIGSVAVPWGDGEQYSAESCKDITELLGEDEPEYYNTQQLKEILIKWIDIREKWNNPEERQKLIEEYEKSEK